MKFKRGTLGVDPDDFRKLHPRMIALALYVDHLAITLFGKQITITSMLRDDGIHACGRAVDFSIKNFKQKELDAMKSIIERAFPYGRGKPTFYQHGEGDNEHIHLQVPWRNEQ